MHPPSLPTVGAEARAGFILPSTLAAMGWERPWGRRRKGEMGRLAPGVLAEALLLLCSSGLNWAAGRMNFSGISSCIPSPGLVVSFLAASQEKVLCEFSCPLQRCCLPQVSKAQGTALSPQDQGARLSGAQWLVMCSGWSYSYVHTSRGITPSLLLRGGSKDSSSRNLRGKWTRWPWTWVSSDRAKGGLTMARGSTATYSRSALRERVALDGKQRKICS